MKKTGLVMASSLGTGMPIKRVVLYDNGYAIFQREATVVGKGHIDLFFDVGLVQSVLQSLRFSGSAAGKVGNIAYEVTKPRANVEISSKNPLADLLKKLKGNQLRLVCHDDGKREEVIGYVLGVDTDLCTSPCDTKIAPHVTILTDSTSIRTIPIHQVRSFVILEPRTQQDIEHSLQLTKDDQMVNMQKITVFYSDVASASTLSCQYGFQVKEWKSSYRLVITDGGTNFHLEGLAIVENTLEEDWNGVNITLVVGAPAIASNDSSSDQGEWLFQIKDFSGIYFTIRANPKDSVLSIKAKIGRKKGYNPFSFDLMFAGKAVEDGRQLSDYTITNGSTLHLSRKESGELKRKSAHQSTTQPQFVMSAQHNLSYYNIDLPVTAQRKQQAIVPLLQADLQGQLVLLYDETIRKGSPLSAFLFENTTGRILEGGSIQVSSVDTFLGEGNLPTLHPGDESPPIPFCVDLGVEVVKTSEVYHLPYYFIDIRDGNIVMSRKKRERTCYVISNKTNKTQDFLLNHFFIDDYELVREDLGNEQEEPVDINDRVYQFRFEVAAKDEKKRFFVVEEATDVSTEAVTNIDQEKLDRLIRKKFIDEATAAELQKIMRIKAEINDLLITIYEKEAEVRESHETQARLRQNIDTVESFNKMEASRYVNSLSAEEDRLKGTQSMIKSQRTKQKDLEKELKHLSTSIKFCRNMNEFNNKK